MRSSNPVFSRTDGFNGAAPVGFDQSPTHTEFGAGTGRMTLESVIEKTAITTGILIATSIASFVFIGSLIGETTESVSQAMGTAGMLSLVGALGGFVLAMVNSFKKVVSPPLVIAYAAIEGLFVGAFSWFVTVQFAGGQLDLVAGAVLGTLFALGGTLAAYKFFNIQVGSRFRKIVIASMFGFVGVSLLDFALSFFGKDFGFNGFGMMGLISSLIGVVIAVFMLILDFDFVERGIAAGLPERESWRAAFGLTVTIVWLYIELLRILAILRGND